MSRAELLVALREVIVERLEVTVPDALQESDRFYEDLHLDSITVLQLIVEVEERFEISVPEEDLDPAVFQTVGNFLTLIEEVLKLASL